MVDAIEVEGLRELNRALRKAENGGAVKAVGRANKRVGRLAADRWLRPRPRPETVGTGAGSSVRPSAAKSRLQLRVGGAHRAGYVPAHPWGRRWEISGGRRVGKRPFILGSLLDHRDELYELWIDEVAKEIGLPRV